MNTRTNYRDIVKKQWMTSSSKWDKNEGYKQQRQQQSRSKVLQKFGKSESLCHRLALLRKSYAIDMSVSWVSSVSVGTLSLVQLKGRLQRPAGKEGIVNDEGQVLPQAMERSIFWNETSRYMEPNSWNGFSNDSPDSSWLKTGENFDTRFFQGCHHPPPHRARAAWGPGLAFLVSVSESQISPNWMHRYA